MARRATLMEELIALGKEETSESTDGESKPASRSLGRRLTAMEEAKAMVDEEEVRERRSLWATTPEDVEGLTDEMAVAIKTIGAGYNVYLCGGPGTGKTYSSARIHEVATSHGVASVKLGSTGASARIQRGETLHGWAGIPVRKAETEAVMSALGREDVVARVREAELVLIDEISMIKESVLKTFDAICKAIRENYCLFGGLVVVAIGDFQQLPPVFKKTIKASTIRELGGGGRKRQRTLNPYGGSSSSFHKSGTRHGGYGRRGGSNPYAPSRKRVSVSGSGSGSHYTRGLKGTSLLEGDEGADPDELHLEEPKPVTLIESPFFAQWFPVTVLLTRSMRHKNPDFAAMQTRLMAGVPTPRDIQILRSRVLPKGAKAPEGVPTILSHRKAVANRNAIARQRLVDKGARKWEYKMEAALLHTQPKAKGPPRAGLAAGGGVAIDPKEVGTFGGQAVMKGSEEHIRFMGMTEATRSFLKDEEWARLKTQVDLKSPCIDGDIPAITNALHSKLGSIGIQENDQAFAIGQRVVIKTNVCPPHVVNGSLGRLVGFTREPCASTIADLTRTNVKKESKSRAKARAQTLVQLQKMAKVAIEAAGGVKSTQSSRGDPIVVLDDAPDTPMAVLRDATFKRLPIGRYTSRDKKAEFSFDPKEKWSIALKWYPIMPASAMTIHMAQGATLQKACIDIEGVWESGQAGVAVSRVTTLESLYILGEVKASMFKADPFVVEWLRAAMAMHEDNQRVKKRTLPLKSTEIYARKQSSTHTGGSTRTPGHKTVVICGP